MKTLFSLQGKKILVTGATGGIGSSVCKFLSMQGAHVVLNGRNEEKLEILKNTLPGGPHSVERFDLINVDEIPKWLKQIVANDSPLYGIVHCAGISSVMPIRLTKWEKAEALMKINWASAWNLAKGFRQHGVFQTDGSRIVFIASTAGIIGEAAMSVYSSSKGAIISLMRSLAAEFAHDSINVNAIAPGFIKTEINTEYLRSITEEQLNALEKRHLIGFGIPEDIAYAVIYLLAESGRWITGTVLTVDGGLTTV